MKTKGLQFFLFTSLLLLMSACQSDNGSEQDASKELTVAAASNLTNVFTELGMAFEEEYDVKVTLSFGSTGQLADQIQHGAPFDVFAAADTKFVQKLKDTNSVIPASTHVYALGQIVVATKETIPPVSNIEELVNKDIKKIAIANPEHAPYGLAAKQAFVSAGIWDTIEDRIVYGRNITDTLTLLETGNVEAAIIALSIVHEDIQYAVIDQALYNPLEQTMAIVQNTEKTELAKKFIDYVNDEGRQTMESYGFIHPDDRQGN